MKKFLKYSLLTLGLLIVTLLIIPFFISLDTYKDTIISQVKKQTGIELEIDGKITLFLFPMPEVTLNKVNLSNLPKANKSSFFKAEKISGKLDFMPLLKRRIIISSIDIKRGFLNYVNATNNLKLQNLNLNISNAELFGFKQPNSGKVNGQGRWSKEKIDLSILKSANASIYLNIGKIISDDIELNNMDLKSELHSGILKIISLSASFLEGKLLGSGSISSNENQPISMKLGLKNAQIHDLLPERGKIKVTNGIIDVACELQSKGYSQYDYINNFEGNMHLFGRDGRISGIDIGQIIAALNKPRNIEGLAKGFEKAFGKGETMFQNLIGEFTIKNGIMNIEKFKLASETISTTSEGLIDLPKFTMDVLAIIHPGLKYLPSVKIHLYGPLDNIQHKIDERAIWKHLLKHALIQEIKPEKLMDGFIKPSNSGKKNKPEDLANQLIQKGLKNLFK